MHRGSEARSHGYSLRVAHARVPAAEGHVMSQIQCRTVGLLFVLTVLPACSKDTADRDPASDAGAATNGSAALDSGHAGASSDASHGDAGRSGAGGSSTAA